MISFARIHPLFCSSLSYVREQIEHEILNSRDLSKKGPPLRRFAYAMRTVISIL